MADDPKREDIDSLETQEWVESIQAVLERDDPGRAHFLVGKLLDELRRRGFPVAQRASTPYVNTIPSEQDKSAGDPEMEKRILSLIRWNAMAMVVRANQKNTGLGGHIGSYASAAHLYEVGFNHFFHAPSKEHGGDLVFTQGHSSPGIYARAFLEGRLSLEQLERFRREAAGSGLSSYPHPWLMPDFWQFATVSMGLSPIMAIYQARFMKYLENRGLAQTQGRHVWAFLGDGEMDEPEAMGALTVASREGLDNLIFVVNCNLQRLDGPVRGNGKIIQELEGVFRGAGWNVIKLLWGSSWDPLLQKDHKGLLRERMEEAVDGEYQKLSARDGAYTRQHFFGKDPQLLKIVSDMSDDQIGQLRRGGHDPVKIYTAYQAAVRHQGGPTVILAKTIKGYGMGEAGQGLNIAHNVKTMTPEQVKEFRARFDVPIPKDIVKEMPFYRPPNDSPEMRYLLERRKALGGFLPNRPSEIDPLEVPGLDAFKTLTEGTGKRENSTTMGFGRILSTLLRDKKLKRHIVPIVADETRTFGMEGLFSQIGIYSPVDQRYEPVDSQQLISYKEAKDGQMLQEGISEAGATCSWIAAGTSYSNHGLHMIPFFIFYSMFGFQRIGDLIWGAADMQARGFLIGGTSGRTTLNGEGLQHEDGHSHMLAANVPSCRAYDPTYYYELAVIIQDGLRRMYAEQESIFYYITTMNENYPHPAMPEGVEEGIRKGLYLLHQSDMEETLPRVQLMGSGSILREVEAAAKLLKGHGVAADVWSATSFTELRREALDAERHNRLHPAEEPRKSYVEECLEGRSGPVIASSDYVRSFADQIRPWVRSPYLTLGTDGYGRSDTREQLRRFFEVDRQHVTVAALHALSRQGKVPVSKVEEAIREYGIDPESPNPVTV